MFGQSSDRSFKCLSAGFLATALMFNTVACATTTSTSCDLPITHLTFHAVRSSGGAVLTGAEYRIGIDELAYGADELRCAALEPRDTASLRVLLNAPRLQTVLADIAAKDYGKTSSNMPHVVLEIGSGPVFIPANLLVEGELRELLRPLDDLFRMKFNRRYRLPLLPTAEEGKDLKRLWSVVGQAK